MTLNGLLNVLKLRTIILLNYNTGSKQLISNLVYNIVLLNL